MIKNISIGKHEIGEGKPCFIIAEAGVNHNGSLKIAKKLVDAAAEAKADAVKFQTFKAENVATANAPMAAYQKKNIGKESSQLDMIRKLELSFQDFAALKVYCDKKGILFLSTPHSFDAVDFLDPLVPAYKIGSGDLTNIPLLEHVAKKNKPIILSTGMANMEEIDEAIKAIRDEGNNMIIAMHCTTSYPCPLKDVNLRAMSAIKKKFNVLVGYSDHTLGIEVPKLASQIGAVAVEKHFTVDKNLPGPDHKSSLDPAELKEMVRAIKEKDANISIDREVVLGSAEKKPTLQEKEISMAVRKSVVANTDIPKGAVITKSMLAVKRPGTGLMPKHLNSLIGRKAKRAIEADSLIQWDDIE